MAPEPLPEPENHKIEGVYSTYSNDELVEAFEGIQKSLIKHYLLETVKATLRAIDTWTNKILSMREKVKLNANII